MTIKLTANLRDPPISGLATAHLIKETHPVEIFWGKETSLEFPNGKKLLCYSNNDILRALARFAPKYQLYGETATERTQIDHWLSFSLTCEDDISWAMEFLEKSIAPVTYLVANKLTIADFALFNEMHSRYDVLQKKGITRNVQRWYNLMNSQPLIQKVLNDLPKEAKEAFKKTAGKQKSPENSGERKQEGKFVDLPGAEMGKVVVRFPPEASGYLHIGHAKAALLNQYYQQAFQGKLIMRFDDTNPAKENVEFEEVILRDLELLKIKPDVFTYSSDYFDLMLEYCEKLMKAGKAYVDDTDPVTMKTEREQRVESHNRSNSVEKNLEMWKEMIAGSAKGVTCCVRAKIDMKSDNGCMRDPTIYRCKPEPHPRSGTKYKVYPTYDFACPIVDAIENVTHTLRTMEYHDRDDQFYWFIEALDLRRPYIWEYSRLNMTNTVLSKRKLTWFVEQGLVDGWDDPRFPTVRGVLRRGMTVEGLKEFIIAQGSSKSVVFMEWDKIWAFNKKVIDPIAPRYTALESRDKTVVVNVAGQTKVENLEVNAHPKNEQVGKKIVTIAPKILIDYVDAEALKEGENATFINWGNLLIKKVNKSNGKITSVDAQLNLENKDFKKTLKLTWLADLPESEYPTTYCVYFDHIISKAVLGKEEDFKSYIGHQTRQEIKMLGDPELKKCKTNDIIQLQRRGYFRVEKGYEAPNELSFVPGPVILYSIPDGHTKEMPTSGNKLASQGTSAAKKPNNADELNKKIVEQGNLVRDLKSKKAAKDQIDVAVKTLLALKADYKAATGSDWKPGVEPPKAATSGAGDICAKITAQGEKVRDLKANKADKATIDAEVKSLLALKAEYKALTGSDWKPGAQPPKEASPSSTGGAGEVCSKITAQGEKVRDLKAKKADKATIDTEVKALLALKAEYKALTGSDWKPGAQPLKAVTPPSAGGAADVCTKITAQGEKVRDLKAKKADKATIDAEVKTLLALKAEYKTLTGADWKPGAQPPKEVSPQSAGGAADVCAKITAQGEKVRDLKSKKADKATIDAEVKTLLALKAEYKTLTGADWKPGTTPTQVKKESSPVTSQEGVVLQKIKDQGDKIRKLKTEKAPKTAIDPEVKTLLSLKAEYKNITGKDWTPESVASNPAAATMSSPKDELTKQVNEQGEKVRQLKTANAPKDQIDGAVKVLLELKAKYKEVTGTDFPTAARGGSSKKSQPKESKPKPAPVKKESADTGVKKQTRLGLEALKEENLPDWYSQVLTKGELIEYYDVSGCYILRHWSFAIWKAIKHWFDAEITKLGVKECYFPIFVSKAALEKEKDHIEDFAPEVAWVTKSGETDLAEPIAVRPTSETVMYPAYAKWIQSYRDLPLKLNQWNNVVRWEFKHPQPFLRTREFLWQEGHTAFATKEEADDEVLTILDLYSKVYTDLLAIPVIKGRKTEKEKFAGGDYTTTVEAFISASGRAIQGATSHHLGQNFSKMCEIVFEDPETQTKKYVFQNSWGITTRTIGVMIMVHADNQGLVLPPRVAAIQAIIVPCGVTVNMKDDERKQLLDNCKNLEKLLVRSDIRCEGDYRDNYSPGWKFNHWELKGVPIRIEIGPKDMNANQMVAVRRDTGEKLILSCDDAEKKIAQLLETIHESMLAKAKLDMTSHTKVTKNWSDFCTFLDQKNIIMSPFCGEKDCEEKIKGDSARDQDAEPGAPAMGAKSLCIPFEQPAQIASNDKCVHPSCSNKPKFYTLFGRSY